MRIIDQIKAEWFFRPFFGVADADSCGGFDEMVRVCPCAKLGNLEG